ncbi:MAG TPA: hypothetical protein VM639_24335 [Dongiaceae bacterium]|nr:hypothetical protein [Dongiaceae bacterium]
MAAKLPKPRSKKSATTTQPEPEAKSAKPTASAQPPAPNALSPSQMKEFAKKAVRLEKNYQSTRERAQAEISSELGIYRAHLKDFKKQGGNPDDLTWYIQMLKRDPDEIARETNRRNELAKLMDLPLFAHVGVMKDGRTVATAIEDAKTGPASTIEQIEAEGYVAGKAAKPMSVCEYAEETPEHDAFLAGWKKGQGENAGVKALPNGGRKANGKNGAAGAMAH